MKASIIQRLFRPADLGSSAKTQLGQNSKNNLYKPKNQSEEDFPGKYKPYDKSKKSEVNFDLEAITCPALAHELKSPDSPPVIIDEHKVFVQFDDLRLTERKMAKIFEQFGPVKNSFFLSSKTNQKGPRRGFIIFYQPESAKKATMAGTLAHNGLYIYIKKGYDKKATKQWVRANEQLQVDMTPKTDCTCTSTRLTLCSKPQTLKSIGDNHMFNGDFRFNEVKSESENKFLERKEGSNLS